MPAKLLLDEHVPLAVAEGLRRSGVDTVHVVETDLRGSPDDTVLTAATEMECVLVTYNVRDFLALASLWADQGRELQGLCDRNVDFGGVVQRRHVDKPDPIRERIVE